MTGFYARWGMVGALGLLLVFLTYQDYQTRLSTIPLSGIMSGNTPKEPIRIQGMVKSGTLAGKVEQGEATFEFTEGTVTIPVEYHGPPPENLRELKVMVLKGRWDAEAYVFKAQDTALVNNYGYVAAAYGVSCLTIVLMLFAMSQRVMVLFKEIKESKLYEPEVDSLAKKQ
ncbi:MAG: cytochrome c maturation protein CcmE [Nitrospirales bacterium]|nr:cytochrome c maturation protein CcmE [Nitrospirales bacterium]